MFELVLTNGVDDLNLLFCVRNSNIAYKWFDELCKNYELYETDRLTNWGSRNFVDEINQCIEIINKYDSFIDRYASSKTTQQDLNYLHKFFEDARGEIAEGTNWFDSAPDNVKDAVQKFNVLIHQLEADLRTKGKHPTAVVTFKNRPRYELSDEDCKNFTYKWKSGTVYINYCQVGKTVLDAFKDNDNIAEAIRPQTHYSADFMVKFGPSTPAIIYYLRKMLIQIWLKRKKFPFKHLNIGMIPVADLVTPVEKSILVKFNKVKEVRCIT